MQKLQITQNKLLRVLSKKDTMYSSDQLHKELELFKITQFRDMFILQFVHNCIKGKPILPFADYFTLTRDIVDYELRNVWKLERNNIRTETGRSTTHYHGATLWNNLQSDLTNIESKSAFKSALKRYYKSI